MKLKYLSLLFLLNSNILFCMHTKPKLRSSTNIREKEYAELYGAINEGDNDLVNDLAAKICSSRDISPKELLGQCLFDLYDNLTPEIVNILKSLGADMNYKRSGYGYNVLELLAKNGINAPLADLESQKLIAASDYFKKDLIKSLILSGVEYEKAIRIAKECKHFDIATLIEFTAAESKAFCSDDKFYGCLVILFLIIQIYVMLRIDVTLPPSTF